MTPEEKRRVLELFEVAVELEPRRRTTFLEEACGGHPELRDEVEALLASDERVGSFLNDPAIQEAIKTRVVERGDSVIGRRIGPYQILREIGQGGMGNVYLAARADEEYRKRAAIKLIKRGMDSDEIVRRFRNERQILASLDHPNIARLLDGGTTEDGLPYFVMDYIEGQPIDQYCDQNKLSIRERLHLFRTICDAVQFAHRNLIVHRDLKPSNMVLTAEGVPKLLDFGIAKILNPELSTESIEPTRVDEWVMTPDYASPEQFRGDPITTATDVYSLGVLLYELLTGHRPYQLKGSGAAELARVICEQEPHRPSSVVARAGEDGAWSGATPASLSKHRSTTPPKLRRRLRGDLDNIVLMALRKEPHRRYGSVEQLSDDLRRHLEGLPVRARKPTLAYRTGKFVTHHKVGVAAAALVVLSLVGGIAATTWQARIAAHQADLAREERNRAQRETAKAERINVFLQEMLSAVDPNKAGRQVTVAEVLDGAAERVEADLADQPEIEAAVRGTLASTYRSLGLYEPAETHARIALEIRRRLFGDEDPAVAESLHELGYALYEKGDYGPAETYLRQAAALYGKRDEHVLAYAGCLNDLAVLLNNKGEEEEAESLYREVLALYQKAGLEDDDRVARVLNNLGVLLGNQGAFQEAEPLHRRALAIMRRVYGEEHPEVATTLYNLAGVLDAQGDYTAAEPLFRQALAMRRRLLGSEHPNTLFTMTSLANLLVAKGEYATAEALAGEAVSLGQTALPSPHPLTAYAQVVLGQALTDGGHPGEGEPHLREALAIRRELLPSDHWLVANTESALGSCLVAQGHYAEAETLLLASYETLRTGRGASHEKTVLTLERLVALYRAWGKSDEERTYQAALLAATRQ